MYALLALLPTALSFCTFAASLTTSLVVSACSGLQRLIDLLLMSAICCDISVGCPRQKTLSCAYLARCSFCPETWLVPFPLCSFLFVLRPEKQLHHLSMTCLTASRRPCLPHLPADFLLDSLSASDFHCHICDSSCYRLDLL